jgi:CHAT domain
VNRPVRFDVTTADVDKAAEGASESQLGPLGFLNACGAGQGVQHGIEVFGTLLLAYGYRAVVGPIIDVPSAVAHEMANAFYRGLFAKNGLTVGDALYQARLQLLQLGSPIGGFYLLYGDPDLSVQTP